MIWIQIGADFSSIYPIRHRPVDERLRTFHYWIINSNFGWTTRGFKTKFMEFRIINPMNPLGWEIRDETTFQFLISYLTFLIDSSSLIKWYLLRIGLYLYISEILWQHFWKVNNFNWLSIHLRNEQINFDFYFSIHSIRNNSEIVIYI